ncbi:MAG: hypothetical protein AAF456_09220 [Planctomycetota bacterium]
MLSITSRRMVTLCALVVGLITCSSGSPASAQFGGSEQLIRITWQNAADNSLHWGEFVQVGPSIVFQNQGRVADFPALEANQSLGPMERIGNIMVMGVRGGAEGQPQGGWLALDLRVIEQPHGDHSDYTYGGAPGVIQTVLDDSRLCPIHLYTYDREFYLANDALNGFTRINPRALLSGGDGAKGTFYRGGGGHITLATVGGKVGYSTWIGETESGTGQVDVVNLDKPGEESVAYSFESPTPGLHGAIANSGRVFLAPNDGIIWVDADATLSQTAESVSVNHLSLGTNPTDQTPNRTGAFTDHRDWVLFLSGRDDDAGLCMVQASAPAPSVAKLVVPTDPGLRMGMPECVTALTGKNYAMAFQTKRAGDAVEKLTIIDLDPNQDRDFSDAMVVMTYDIGDGGVEGYRSYHSLCFDDDNRFAVFTNPADGEICLLALDTLNLVGRYKVDGIPTGVLAIGGEASKH